MKYPILCRMLVENKGYYQFAGAFGPNLICVFSKRPQNMSLAYGDTRYSLENRRDLLTRLGVDYNNLVCAKQIHGEGVRYAQESDRGKGAIFLDDSMADADALITDKRNLPLAVFTADCLSVFLYDCRIPAIGLVHAGWRSSRQKIVEKAVQLMQEKFGTAVKDLYAGLGPAIRSCCYEVGRDFADFFPRELSERGNRYYLDLAGLNKKQLLDLGVGEKNIFDSNICTSCRNTEFFSYRRQGYKCGRMISVMMLR